jgi:hypothetical protein
MRRSYVDPGGMIDDENPLAPPVPRALLIRLDWRPPKRHLAQTSRAREAHRASGQSMGFLYLRTTGFLYMIITALLFASIGLLSFASAH